MRDEREKNKMRDERINMMRDEINMLRDILIAHLSSAFLIPQHSSLIEFNMLISRPPFSSLIGFFL
jgi:hypothetical protein